MEEKNFMKSPSSLSLNDGIIRQSADYTPSVWGDYFIKHFTSSPFQVVDSIKAKVEVLIGDVKTLLKSTRENIKCMELIDALQRLGVDYHFEKEIDDLLERIHEHGDTAVNDLYEASLKFRLLRQHSYYVESDVFNKFKDGGGKFKEIFVGNVRGLLSLYEACYWGTPEEIILEEALSFAKKNLQISLLTQDVGIVEQVSHALEMPLRRRIPRLEARSYIAIYDKDKEIRNDHLIELAKLDFNLLQLLHQQEVRSLSIWWQGIINAEDFSFTRDRIVECYFWIISVYFEPKYARARLIATKVIALMSIMDDIYDVYGTLEELILFTDVIERWDEETSKKLEGCLKVQFHNLHNTFKEFEEELTSEEKSYRVDYLKEIVKVTTRAWLQEAKWRDQGYVPMLEEHLQVTLVTTCYNLLSCASFIGMDDVATKNVFDWILTFPKLTQHSSLICRLRDDITSHEIEEKRHHVTSTIHCYIKEHNSSKKKACEELLNMVEDAWKSLNKEYLSLKGTFPKDILLRVVNFTRVIDSLYDLKDIYTNANLLKGKISLVLVDPIPF